MRPAFVVMTVNSTCLGLSLILIVLLAASLLIAGRAARPESSDPRPHRETLAITVAIGAEPTRLDPHDARDAPSSLINYHIYDRLVDVGPDGAILPGLARSWQISPDGREYTFSLQRGVRFHDGLPLTASAVVANFERLLAPGSYLSRAELISPYVESIAAIDEETISIRLRRPLGPFLRYLSHESLGIVSPRSIEAAKEGRALPPVGTGPFVLKEWVPGDRVTLVAFPEHWRGAPKIDVLIFKPIPDGSSRAIALETGVADIAYPLDPVHLMRLRDRPGVRVTHAPSQRVIYAALNLGRPPLDERAFRHALNHAVDVEAITKHLLFGLARPLDSPLATSTWGHASVSPYQFDPRKAREMLASVAGPVDRPLELWSPVARYVQDRAVAQAIAGYLREVGLDVRIRLFEWGSYLALLSTNDTWDLAILGWVPASGEADMALRPLYHSESRGNHSGYFSPAVDRQLDEAIFSTDPNLRMSLYHEVQATILRDAPVLFLYSLDLTYGYRAEIGGIQVYSTEIVDLRSVFRHDPP